MLSFCQSFAPILDSFQGFSKMKLPTLDKFFCPILPVFHRNYFKKAIASNFFGFFVQFVLAKEMSVWKGLHCPAAFSGPFCSEQQISIYVLTTVIPSLVQDQVSKLYAQTINMHLLTSGSLPSLSPFEPRKRAFNYDIVLCALIAPLRNIAHVFPVVPLFFFFKKRVVYTTFQR